MWSSSNRVEGLEWLVVALGFLIDLGAFSKGRRRRARTA
jgi:hypothetical protein